MRISTAYFAGVGTVIVAVAAGLGGGYLAANIANPPPGVSKLERRMSAEPISVAAAPAQPAPRATSPTSAPTQERPQTVATAAPSDAAIPVPNTVTPPNTNRAEERPVRTEEKPANNIAAVQPAAQPARLIEPKSADPSNEKVGAPREAFARARDADVKRADAEKRRVERRQAWTERRRVQQPREQELEAVEERVREVTEPRRIRIREESEPREMYAERARGDQPRIRLFDRDE
jgi:hypothetical protein